MNRSARMVALLVPLLAMACADSGEIRIGYAGPRTGPSAQTGAAVQKGVKLAVDEFNAARIASGKKATLFEEDDAGDPARAVAAAKSLCSKDIVVVVGHVDSGCTLKARPIYTHSGVVMITPTSTHPEVTDGGEGTVFRVCGRDDSQGREGAVWAARQGVSGPLCVLNDGGAYGARLAREFQDNFEFLSGSKAVLSEIVPPAPADLAQLVGKVKGASPGLIYFGGLAQRGGALLKALRAAGVNGVFLAGDGCFGDEFLQAAGPEAAEGARMTFIKDLSGLPATAPVAKAYRIKYGDPGPYGLFGYAAAKAALDAVEAAIHPVGQNSISQALHRLQFKTVFGLARFDEKGDITENPWIVWRVEGGRFWECRDFQPLGEK